MTWLCALKWFGIVATWIATSWVLLVGSYAAGYRTATRKHWDMMHRVGSTITKERGK